MIRAYLVLIIGAAVLFAQHTGDAIQEKIDALPETGGIVRLEKGVYTVERSIVLKRSGIVMDGIPGGTVLKLAPSVRSCGFITPLDTRITGLRMRNIIIDGNADEQIRTMFNYGTRAATRTAAEIDNVGIYLRNAEDCLLENMHIRNFQNEALYLMGCKGISVVGMTIEHCSREHVKNDMAQGCIYLRMSSACLIMSNTMSNNFEGGVVIGHGSASNTVVGNSNAVSASGEGYYIGNASYNRVIGNYTSTTSYTSDRGAGSGIAIASYSGYPAEFNIISNNRVHIIGGSGIAAVRVTNLVITDNEISNANTSGLDGKAGISIYQCRSVSARGNTVIDTRGPAVAVQFSAACVFEQNTLRGNRERFAVNRNENDVHLRD